MAKNKIIRSRKSRDIRDIGAIADMTYNEAAGSRKSSDFGHYLVPIDDGAGGKTTTATSVKALALGVTLAVYNNDSSVHAIRLSASSSATALAAGIVDSASGEVGIPIPPNSYKILNNYTMQYLIADSNKLIVMIVLDDSRVTAEIPNY